MEHDNSADNELDESEFDESEFDDELDDELDDDELDNAKIQLRSTSDAADRGRKIEWDETLSVDIPEIDELQKKIFMILNGLINRQEQDEEVVAKDSAGMVVELTEYSRYYFSREEDYLRKSGYPDIDSHSKEHRQFIKNTINLRRQVAEDKKNLSYDTVSFLRDWLVNHISHSDHMYVPFVRINSYIEDSRLKR